MNAGKAQAPARTEHAATRADGRAEAVFADERPQAAQMKKLQDAAGNSQGGRRFAAVQAMIDRSPLAQQKAAQLQAAENAQAVAQLMKTADLQDEVKPGPPPTYRVGTKYVKKLKNQEKASEIHTNWMNAWVGGLPVPSFSMEKLEDASAWVFWAESAKGDTFFQFSKPGHLDLFKQWLQTQPKGHLVELEQVFTGYLVGDPQGFYENKPYGKIEFIDVQKKVSGGPMKDVGDFITSLLNG